MVWVNMFAYVHKMPQGQTGGKIFFSVEYILTHMGEKFRSGEGEGGYNNLLPKARVKRRIWHVPN